MERLTLSGAHYQAMLADVRQRTEEACGIIAGIEGRSRGLFVVPNELHSQTRFRMLAEEQIAAFLEMERLGWDMLAIYHSHPAGPDHPSETDLAEHAYPGVYSVIWYPEGDGWACRAYRIIAGKAELIDIVIVADE